MGTSRSTLADVRARSMAEAGVMHATKELNRGSSGSAGALHRIEEVLRLSRSAVWETDLDGIFTYVSPSFEDLLGYRPEELVGRRTIHDFYAPDRTDDRRARSAPERVARAGEFTDLVIPLVAKSGKIVWISSSGTPIRGADGRVTGARGVDTDITALKQAEENLRASERALWRQIQEAPVPMAFTSLEAGGDLQVNRAFVRVFGYAPEEVRTLEAWFARAYPVEADRLKVQEDAKGWLEQAAAGEVPAPLEYRITCKDGRVLDVEVGAAIVAGKLVGTFTDVTLRRRELELRKAREEELQRVLDNLPFPVATSLAGADFDWQDPRAQVTFLNRRFTELFGYTRGDIPTVAAWARRALPDATRRHGVFAVLDRQVRAALRGEGEVGPVEVPVTCRDGSVREVLLQAVAVDNQLVISLEDITERNRARQRLEESKERLRAVVENTPIPISYTLAGGTEVNLNKAFTGTFGWTEKDVPTVDEWFAKAYPDPVYRGEVLARWGADVERAQRGDGNIDARLYRVMAKDGTLREVEISAVLVEGELFGSFLDVTERHAAERKLREQQEQLARVGRVSALGQLAASLAHELEQPLAAILNNAQAADLLLQEEGAAADRAELRSILRDILADNQRAGAVLDRIGAMVRRQRFETSALEVPSLLEEVAALVLPSLAPRRVALEISCEEGLPPVEGDRVLLQQVLLNLALNSVEAIGSRKDGRIFVQAGRTAEDTVEVRVRDNGGGVAADDLDKLLVPFHSTKATGLGMGLPLAQSIMEQHGGAMRFDNEEGRGLTVLLALPVWRGAKSS